MATVADFILDNGGFVHLECEDEDTYEFWESIENAMKCRGWWSPGKFDGCSATYLGNHLDRVNMGRVIGMA